MQLFDCKIHHDGSLYNEIRKEGVTIPEIIILRLLHGGADHVVDIVPTREAGKLDAKTLRPVFYVQYPNGRGAAAEGMEEQPTVPWTDRWERERLERRYRTALLKVKDVRSINGVFGVAAPLPITLDGVTPAVVETSEPIRRTRVAQKPVDDLAELGAA